MVNYHHTPTSFNTSGTHNVTIDTVYRLASVSKMYTALAVLQLSDKINMTDPVTKYVPELAQLDKQQAQVNDITTVRWAKITIDALLSHLGGISEDCRQIGTNLHFHTDKALQWATQTLPTLRDPT